VRIVRCDPGIAEDLTVEALWRIYRARRQFRPNGNFGGLGTANRHEFGARSSPV
jgi:DNA-directed RNA polymerase specialized sigma24 family protein